ncbi:MAG TPA: hypothetical protein VGL59_14185 [Polyangia bacterium]|jgi:hypothetical protein
MRLTNTLGVFVVAAVGAGVMAVGCGSSSSDCSDGGTCTTNTGTGGTTADAGGTGGTGPTLFGITEGTYCFDIVSIASGATDGCDLGVADQVGKALPVNYVMATATVTLGTDGSLGAGPVASNMGTLTRDNMPTDPMMTTCMWHQTDTTTLVLTDTNQFTASVVETESNFSAAPACDPIPTGGTCTSTWTWTMKINGNKSTANGCM